MMASPVAGAQTAGGGGGQLITVIVEIDPNDKGNIPDPYTKVTFQYNPKDITMSRKIPSAPQKSKGRGQSREQKNPEPWEFKFGEVYFDTFETRENVREKYIRPFEYMLDFEKNKHKVPRLFLNYGQFTAQSNQGCPVSYNVRLSSFKVTYVMFLKNGTPVRAKVDLAFKEDVPQESQGRRSSPDHAKFRTVRRGDTLQSIAFEEYNSPAEWRRIADANSIDDPMAVAPGTKLIVPPILR